MQQKTPYEIVKSQYITEKAMLLEQLKNSDSNKCSAKCESPKYVFIVEKRANKIEIAKAIEEIYKEKNVKVASVNTINIKPKKRRVRGRIGFKPGFKKAIITLANGDSLDDV